MSDRLHFTTDFGNRTWCGKNTMKVRYALTDKAKPYDLVTFKDARPKTPWCSKCVKAMAAWDNCQ